MSLELEFELDIVSAGSVDDPVEELLPADVDVEADEASLSPAVRESVTPELDEPSVAEYSPSTGSEKQPVESNRTMVGSRGIEGNNVT